MTTWPGTPFSTRARSTTGRPNRLPRSGTTTRSSSAIRTMQKSPPLTSTRARRCWRSNKPTLAPANSAPLCSGTQIPLKLPRPGFVSAAWRAAKAEVRTDARTCHPERSEDLLCVRVAAGSKRKQILRVAQDDKIEACHPQATTASSVPRPAPAPPPFAHPLSALNAAAVVGPRRTRSNHNRT